MLDCVEIEPARARRSVVWLHGLGADGYDFEPIVPHLGLDASMGVRFIFPHAPRMPVTLNMGMVMPAWYDIVEMDLRRHHDKDGIRKSAKDIEELLAREKSRGIAAEHIVLAGFSQGGAMALHVGLRHAEKLAGIMALSSYLVLEDDAAIERTEVNQATPIFQAHGEFDPTVRFERGKHCRDKLEEWNYDVQWKIYPMEHQVHPQEIVDIGAWLRGVLA